VRISRQLTSLWSKISQLLQLFLIPSFNMCLGFEWRHHHNLILIHKLSVDINNSISLILTMRQVFLGSHTFIDCIWHYTLRSTDKVLQRRFAYGVLQEHLFIQTSTKQKLYPNWCNWKTRLLGWTVHENYDPVSLYPSPTILPIADPTNYITFNKMERQMPMFLRKLSFYDLSADYKSANSSCTAWEYCKPCNC
jgi:hypothetical protein